MLSIFLMKLVQNLKSKVYIAIKKPEIGLLIKEIKKLNYGLQIKKLFGKNIYSFLYLEEILIGITGQRNGQKIYPGD